MGKHTTIGKNPGLLAQIAAQTVDRLKKEWQWFFHPLQSLRRWGAEVMSVQAQGPVGNQGTVPQPGQAQETKAYAKEQVAQITVMQAAKEDTPNVEETWTHL